MVQHLSFSERLNMECAEAAVAHAIAEGESLRGLRDSGNSVIQASLDRFDQARVVQSTSMKELTHQLDSLRSEINMLLSLAKTNQLHGFCKHPFLQA